MEVKNGGIIKGKAFLSGTIPPPRIYHEVLFPNEPTEANTEKFLWKVVIHMAFVLSGVFFALMDRIAAGTPSH
jgi:uncharacterized membrane protein YqhA